MLSHMLELNSIWLFVAIQWYDWYWLFAALLLLPICGTIVLFLFVARFNIGYLWHNLLLAIRRIDKNSFSN